MISGGDEMGRTQEGNNNAYCQDNEISWIRWDLDPADRDFLEFTRRLIRIRKEHPVLRRRKFFQGRRIRGAEVQDIAWLDPSGREMTDEAWNSPDVRRLGVRLNGDAIDEVDERGQRITGDTLLLLLNADRQPVAFVLPATRPEERWATLVDTADPWLPARRLRGGDRYQLPAHAMAVLQLTHRKHDLLRATDWGPMGVY
jgi:isoamylase